MEERRPTGRELLPAVWAAMLTPMTRLLPGACARLAGPAGWLAPLFVLPGVLLLAALPKRIVRREEDGLAPAMKRLLGSGAANAAYLIYIIWAVILTAARLRLSGEYFLSAVGQRDRLWVTLLPMVCLSAWLAAKQRAAIARTGALAAWILAAALLGWVLLSLFRVRTENLWPVPTEGLLPAAWGGMLSLGVTCAGIYAAFLGWQPDTGRRGEAVVPVASWVLVQICVTGGLGAALAARTEDPFTVLSRGMGVEGAVQRVESLMAALGLLSDLTMAALLLGAGRRLLSRLRPQWNSRGCAGLLAGVAGLLALTLFRQAATAGRFGLTAAPAGNFALGLALPAVLYLLERRQKKLERGGISCVAEGNEREDVVRGTEEKKSLRKPRKKC